jgi:hypothetical protein
LVLATMALTLVGLSNAATVALNASFGPSLTDFTQALALGKFDTSLGSLVSGTLTGGGTFDIGGNLGLSQATHGTLAASVTYAYQPSGVPEPITMFLMGSALVGVGLLLKRMKS